MLIHMPDGAGCAGAAGGAGAGAAGAGAGGGAAEWFHTDSW